MKLHLTYGLSVSQKQTHQKKFLYSTNPRTISAEEEDFQKAEKIRELKALQASLLAQLRLSADDQELITTLKYVNSVLSQQGEEQIDTDPFE